MADQQSKALRLADHVDRYSPPGFTNEIAAELRRLAAVEEELERTKKSLALVQQHHTTAWNRGHEAGMRASRDAVTQATDAVARDAWGNTQLTEALLAVEAERDKLRADYEQACKLVADMHMAAMGQRIGPVLGVVEDVAALRAQREADRAAMRQALEALGRSAVALNIGHGCVVALDDSRAAITTLRERLEGKG